MTSKTKYFVPLARYHVDNGDLRCRIELLVLDFMQGIKQSVIVAFLDFSYVFCIQRIASANLLLCKIQNTLASQF